MQCFSLIHVGHFDTISYKYSGMIHRENRIGKSKELSEVGMAAGDSNARASEKGSQE